MNSDQNIQGIQPILVVQTDNKESDEVELEQEVLEYQELLMKIIKCEELDYWIGNPVVQIITGTLFIKQREEIKKVKSIEDYCAIQQQQQQISQISSNVLICPAIPYNKSPIEFCEFISSFEHQVKEMKVMKTSHPKFYSIIILFENSIIASKFHQIFNCKKYNEIEFQLCIVQEVEQIIINVEPYNLKKDDSEIIKLQKPNSVHSEANEKLSPENLFMIKKIQCLQQPLQLQQQANLDLDNNWQQKQQCQEKCIFDCAICFEKLILDKEQSNSSKINKISSSEQLDLLNSEKELCEITWKKQQISGQQQQQQQDTLIGILCGHYFHRSCLSNWKNSNNCPLCRYHQYPPDVSYCEYCGANETLWICLVCGSINCGFEFMQNSHMGEHYEKTKHTYAMEIDSKFVYDHSKKQFVHRLLQNYLDGKIVEIDQEAGKEQEQKKFRDIIREYEVLMGKELETQRNFFKQKLNDIQKKTKNNLDSLSKKEQELENQYNQLVQKVKDEQNILNQQEQHFQKQREQFMNLNSQMNQLEKENQQLMKESQDYEIQSKKATEMQLDKLKHLKSEVLKSTLELKDLEAHIKAKEKLKNQLNSKDASEATMLIMDQGETNKKKKQNKK